MANFSRDNFTAIVELPEGRHQYKFFVDGDWVHDPGEVSNNTTYCFAITNTCINSQECQDNGLGTLNNVVNVTQKDFDLFNQLIDVSSLQKGLLIIIMIIILCYI